MKCSTTSKARRFGFQGGNVDPDTGKLPFLDLEEPNLVELELCVGVVGEGVWGETGEVAEFGILLVLPPCL